MAKVGRAYLEIDISGMVKFRKYTRSSRKQQAYAKAADRILKFLRNRYIALSSKTGGSAEWPKLADKTVAKKEALQKKGKLKASSPEWILRRTNTIVNSFSYRLVENGFVVGILTRDKYPKVEENDTPRSIRYIANQHQVGNSKMPQRRIVVMPPLSVKRQAINDIQKMFSKAVEEANPKGLKK